MVDGLSVYCQAIMTREVDPIVLESLVLQAQEGDATAFGRVYDHFFPQVYRYAAFRCPQEIAEDLVADIFVKAWEKLHTYRLRTGIPFGAWLFRIARHTVIDVYRTQRGFEEVPEDIADTDVLNRADVSVKREELQRVVNRALDRLPRRAREALLLPHHGALPHSEIARVLRMREGTVRVLKFRALKRLGKLLPGDTREMRAVYSFEA